MSDRHERVVSVVTPVRDGAHLIEETMRSVLGQTAVRSGRVRLDYVIADGGSEDGTVELAQRIGGGQVRVVSRPDEGMYDALASVWSEGSDVELMAYLNAGDLWLPTALDVVLDVMEESGAQWVTGQRLLLNEAGHPTAVDLPFRYRPRLIRAGMYDGSRLPHIQQESTFWRSSMMSAVDLGELASCRLAGDHYLWSAFARLSEPVVVEALLGGFRAHSGQLSTDLDAYTREMRALSHRPTIRDRLAASLDKVWWHAPPRLKKRLNASHLLRYDHASRTWG